MEKMSSNKSNKTLEENGEISNGEITQSIKDERFNSKNEKTFEICYYHIDDNRYRTILYFGTRNSEIGI